MSIQIIIIIIFTIHNNKTMSQFTFALNTPKNNTQQSINNFESCNNHSYKSNINLSQQHGLPLLNNAYKRRKSGHFIFKTVQYQANDWPRDTIREMAKGVQLLKRSPKSKQNNSININPFLQENSLQQPQNKSTKSVRSFRERIINHKLKNNRETAGQLKIMPQGENSIINNDKKNIVGRRLLLDSKRSSTKLKKAESCKQKMVRSNLSCKMLKQFDKQGTQSDTMKVNNLKVKHPISSKMELNNTKKMFLEVQQITIIDPQLVKKSTNYKKQVKIIPFQLQRRNNMLKNLSQKHRVQGLRINKKLNNDRLQSFINLQ